MMRKLFIVINMTSIAALFASDRGYSPNLIHGEAVERISVFWKSKENIYIPDITMAEKAWYQDNIGIAQVCRISFTPMDTIEPVKIIPILYRFVDLRRNWVYEYLSFSDTASIARKYKATDTTLYIGGWNFLNRAPFKDSSFLDLSDSSIAGINYKRCKINYQFKGVVFEGVGMSRCDKKGTRFDIDTTISKKVGCPLVFFRIYPKNKPNSGIDQKVNFISNILPDSVIKVFTAWKRNEALHPLQ